MSRLALLSVAAATLIATGCGGGENGDDGSASGATDASRPTRGATEQNAKAGADATIVAARTAASGIRVRVIDSDFGRVIADGKGEAFYLFGKDGAGPSECYGACASVWPPVITKGAPGVGKGAKANLLGTTRRGNGKLQVTYAGQPLYYYEHDSPGTILCHDVAEFGGLWLVVKPNGEAAA